MMVWVWNVSHKLLGLSPTPTPQKAVVLFFIGSFGWLGLFGFGCFFWGGGRVSLKELLPGGRKKPWSWIAGPHFLFMFASWYANILGKNPSPMAAATSSSGVPSKHGSNKPFLQSVGSCWFLVLVVRCTRDGDSNNSFKFQISQLVEQATTVPEPQTCA